MILVHPSDPYKSILILSTSNVGLNGVLQILLIYINGSITKNGTINSYGVKWNSYLILGIIIGLSNLVETIVNGVTTNLKV